MKRLTGLFFLLIGSVAIITGCKNQKGGSDTIQALNSHEVKVQEFINTSEYTYLRVKEGNAEYWMAAPKRETKKGQTLYYTTYYEMLQWKSTELDRTFDRVLFIQDLTDTPPVNMGSSSGSDGVHMGTPRNQQQQQQQPIQINNSGPAEATGTIEEEISLNELLTNTEKYSNKIVTISGKVIKVNPAIMARNWVHITADPDDGNNYDLTFTTQEEFTVDQVVTIQGQISINRDFGAGYTYQVILENARQVSK